jgi:membrane-bound lytic murein transglycosylase D
MILAAVIIAKNPVKYGFDAVIPAAAAVETVDVPAAVDLRRIAEWAAVPVDEIQRLNPELRRWTTPIRGETYPLRVPMGTAYLIRGQLTLADPATLNALQWHVVRRGETLSTIARKLRVSRTDLAEANFLRTSSRVQVGQKLLIPRMPSAALLARAASGEAVSADAVPAVFEETAAQSEIEDVVYRVKRGDTLYEIARRYQTTVAKLKQLNGLRSNTLRIGARLVVASNAAANAQQQ